MQLFIKFIFVFRNKYLLDEHNTIPERDQPFVVLARLDTCEFWLFGCMKVSFNKE